jgi:hypothetical protein
LSYSRILGKLIHRRSAWYCKGFSITLPLVTASLSLGLVDPNPTSALSRAIRTIGPLEMKENSAFSFIVKRDSLVQRQSMIGPWCL